MVYIYIDEVSGRITGTTKFKRNQNYENVPFKRGDKVDLIIAGQSELGWNVVVNKKISRVDLYFRCFQKNLYPLSDEMGYIKTIREDGKIDVTLQKQGFVQNIDEFKQKKF